MKGVWLLVLLITAAVAAKKGSSKAALGYRECNVYREKYRAEETMKWVKPKPLNEICGVDGECPPVEELSNSHCGFGIRELGAGKWVSTELRDSDGEGKYTRAFLRLFNYINGPGNKRGVNVPMTTPVVTQVYLDDDYQEEGGNMNFYLPAEFQDNPPEPSSELLEIQDWEPVVVYYRAFGYKGKGNTVPQELWDREFQTLADAVVKAGLDAYWTLAITSTFTQPGVGEQRNEVIFTARRHYQYSYRPDQYDWDVSRGYEECAKYPNVVKPKALDGICGKSAECPMVDDLETKGCGYGSRNIKAGVWATTRIWDSDGEQKHMYAFWRLFSYLRGENERDEKIEMTVPVIQKTYLDESFQETWSTLHFYLPPEIHDNPPEPTDERVSLQRWVDSVVHYRTVGEYEEGNVEPAWEQTFKELSDVLRDASESFYSYVAVKASFTRPGYGDQRHEAIALAEDDGVN